MNMTLMMVNQIYFLVFHIAPLVAQAETQQSDILVR